MKTKILLVTMFISVFACNDDSSPRDESVSGDATVVQKLEILDAFGQPETVFNQGETITFSLSAMNTANVDTSLVFGSSHQTDFIVRDPDDPNKILWDYNQDRVFLPVITYIDLLPLETKVFQVNWNQIQSDGTALPAGIYLAEATFVNGFAEIVFLEFEVR